MKVWDTRLPEPCVHTLSLPDKVYTMDATDDRVVIGMNNRHVLLFGSLVPFFYTLLLLLVLPVA